MPHKQKATDEQILKAYKKTKSIVAVGSMFGMRPSSAHERLKKLGVVFRNPRWTVADDEILRRDYVAHREKGTLSELAANMSRTRQFICRRAKAIGLTDSTAPRAYLRVWKGMDEAEALKHFRKFQKSSYGLGAYCKRFGYDDLGFSRIMKEHFADQWEAVIEAKQPLQTMYRLGRSVEYAVRDELREWGYFSFRSPRSLGPVDVMGIKKGVVVMVQCKRSLTCTVTEWNAIYSLAESIGAIPLVAGRPTGKGITYMKITGAKDGSKRRQPWVEMTIGDIKSL